MTESIPVLTWTRGKNTGDLYARLPDGLYQIFAIEPAGFELWMFTAGKTKGYLGWFAHEDEAQQYARTHVGDGE